jgi:hypothetical protein
LDRDIVQSGGQNATDPICCRIKIVPAPILVNVLNIIWGVYVHPVSPKHGHHTIWSHNAVE